MAEENNKHLPFSFLLRAFTLQAIPLTHVVLDGNPVSLLSSDIILGKNLGACCLWSVTKSQMCL